MDGRWRERLVDRATELAEAYRAAEPFPHVVIDGLFDEDALTHAIDHVPSTESVAWYRYDNPLERKLAMPHIDELADEIRAVFGDLDSQQFVMFLEALTGIEGLVPDGEHVGAGIHQVPAGGSLAVHVDSNRHPVTGLTRRVNVLVYLNKDWASEYGGHLELWDPTMTRAVRRILPTFNRTVIFNCSDAANHGHPEPLACPPHRTRLSFAAFFYTESPAPIDTSTPRSTLFKRRRHEPIDSALDDLRTRRSRGRLSDDSTTCTA